MLCSIDLLDLLATAVFPYSFAYIFNIRHHQQLDSLIALFIYHLYEFTYTVTDTNQCIILDFTQCSVKQKLAIQHL